MRLDIAPEFDVSLDWLTPLPVRLASLRGHPVVLLFWNAGSATSHNALQAIGALQHRYRGQVAFVGIHVPKFDAERDAGLVRDVLAGQGVPIACANDADWATWQHYEVAAWPTAILVDPDGLLVQRFVGDRAIDGLPAALEPLLDAGFERRKAFVEPPRAAIDPPGLQIGGMAASANRLYIADTARHRLLECTHDGRVLRRIGTGNRDFVDGLADAAGFSEPRGLVLLQDRLYVADAGNHAIRRVDVRTGEVDTLVGQGKSGDPVAGALGLPGSSPLDRPWALAAQDSSLYIGLAAGQTWWVFELGRRVLRPLSGTGALGMADGPADVAEYAHPAAIALVGGQAYILDAAASALRQLDPSDGSVRTLVGRGLVEFGHKDGGIRQALMQAPTGLAASTAGDALWIADTGNGLVRRYGLRQQSLTTPPMPPGLKRPGALAVWQHSLWIADPGSRALWRFDTDIGQLQRLSVED